MTERSISRSKKERTALRAVKTIQKRIEELLDKQRASQLTEAEENRMNWSSTKRLMIISVLSIVLFAT